MCNCIRYAAGCICEACAPGWIESNGVVRSPAGLLSCLLSPQYSSCAGLCAPMLTQPSAPPVPACSASRSSRRPTPPAWTSQTRAASTARLSTPRAAPPASTPPGSWTGGPATAGRPDARRCGPGASNATTMASASDATRAARWGAGKRGPGVDAHVRACCSALAHLLHPRVPLRSASSTAGRTVGTSGGAIARTTAATSTTTAGGATSTGASGASTRRQSGR